MFWMLFLIFLSPYLSVFIPSLAVFSISVEWIAFINAGHTFWIFFFFFRFKTLLILFFMSFFISLSFLPFCFFFLSSLLRACLSVSYFPQQNLSHVYFPLFHTSLNKIHRMYISLCFLFPSTKFIACIFPSVILIVSSSHLSLFLFLSYLISTYFPYFVLSIAL